MSSAENPPPAPDLTAPTAPPGPDLTAPPAPAPPPAPGLTTPRPSPGPGGLPPASVIAFLFADQFAPLEKAGVVGTEAFVTGKVVVRKALAEALLGIALWSLREQGAVRWELVSVKKLGVLLSRTLRVFPVGEPVEAAGIEGGMLNVLAKARKALDKGVAAESLMRTVVPYSYYPDTELVGKAVSVAQELGYLTVHTVQDAPTRVLHAKRRHTEAEPNLEAIHALDAVAGDLAGRWKAFQETEPEVYARFARYAEAGIRGNIRDSDSSLDD